jgi:outer membrane protein TolC
MKKLLPFLCLFLSGPGWALAEATLTWEQCVKEASERNLDLLSARQSLKAAENSHLASLGTFLPQVSLGASAGRSGTDRSVEEALANPSSTQSVGLSLGVRQNLFSGLKDFAAVDSANAQVRSARARLQQSKAKLSEDLTSAFYGLVFSQEQVKLLGLIAQRRRSNAKLVELTYQGGKDSKGSLQQAQASSLQADHEAAQAARDLRIAQRRLAKLLDRDPLEPLVAQGRLTAPSPVPEPRDFREVAKTTPAYLLALAQLHLAENRLTSARGDFLPTLSANASLSRGGPDFASLSPSWSAGFSLSLPLLSGGSDLFNYKAAEEEKKVAEYALRSALQDSALALETAHAGLASAQEKVGVQRAFLEAAQTRARIAKAQYLNGLLSFQDWDQIESGLTDQEKSELTSLLAAVTAGSGWESAQGKGAIP